SGRLPDGLRRGDPVTLPPATEGLLDDRETTARLARAVRRCARADPHLPGGRPRRQPWDRATRATASAACSCRAPSAFGRAGSHYAALTLPGASPRPNRAAAAPGPRRRLARAPTSPRCGPANLRRAPAAPGAAQPGRVARPVGGDPEGPGGPGQGGAGRGRGVAAKGWRLPRPDEEAGRLP